MLQLRREPYWVAPEATLSIIDASAGALSRFLPAGLRHRRAREQLIAEAERAALRNVANLDWSLRQNIEDSMRRFETALGHQLEQALGATREALNLALDKRAARSAAIEGEAAEAKRIVDALSGAMAELRAPQPTAPHRGAAAC